MLIPAIGIFDLETTGVDPATDRIVTAYVGVLDEDGNVIDGREWMIAPSGYVIPEGATAIHGISTEQALAEGRPFAEVIDEIVAAIDALTVPIAGHNLSYDLTMLAHEMHRNGHPDPVGLIDALAFLDTFILDKELDKWRKGKRTLSALAPLHNVRLTAEEAHGAAADAIAAGRIALSLIRHPQVRDLGPDELRRRQTGWARWQRASFMDYRRRTGEPVEVDLNWPLYTSALAFTVIPEVVMF